MPVRVIDTITPRGNFPVVETQNLGGAFIKSLAIAGNVLVMTVQSDSGVEEIFRFTGGIQAGTFIRRAAVRTNTSFTASNFTATSENESIIPPSFTSPSHIAFWQPSTALELTDIRLQGAPSSIPINSFTLVELEISGTAGYYWYTTNTLGASNSGRVWVLTSTSHLRTFKRYFSRVIASEDMPNTPPTFTSTDFTRAGDITSSLSSIISISAYVPRTTSTYWHGYAVPNDTPDLTSIKDINSFRRNLIGDFEKQASTVSIDSTVYKVYRSKDRFFDFSAVFEVL